MSKTERPPEWATEHGRPLVSRAAVVILGALVLALAVGAGYLLGSPPDRGVEPTGEFTGTVTAMNERSICVSGRGDDEGDCGIPVLLDADAGDPVKVGNTVDVTTMWLDAPDGTRYEAWYVRAN